MSSDSKNCKMYVKTVGGVEKEYRYGEPWVMMQLLIDGGYQTKEDAVLAWEQYVDSRKDPTESR